MYLGHTNTVSFIYVTLKQSLHALEAVALAAYGSSEMLTIHSSDDVAKVIKEKTKLTHDVTAHYKEKTEEVNKSL